MKLSARELMLAWVTGLVVLAVVSYLFLDPLLKDRQQLQRKGRDVRGQIEGEQRMIETGPEWRARWQKILEAVPRHARGEDVTASLMKEIEAQANAAGFNIVQRNASQEEEHQEYSNLDISCRGTSSLDAILAFLFDLKSASAMMRVTQLRIDKSKYDYNIRLTVSCIYGRTES